MNLYTKVLSRFKRLIPFLPPTAILISTANLSFCKVMHVRMRDQLHPICRIVVLRFLLQSAAIRLSALHIFPFFFLLFTHQNPGMYELSPFIIFFFLLRYLYLFFYFYLLIYLFIRIMPTGTEMILHLVGDKEKERKNKWTAMSWMSQIDSKEWKKDSSSVIDNWERISEGMRKKEGKLKF